MEDLTSTLIDFVALNYCIIVHVIAAVIILLEYCYYAVVVQVLLL